MANGKINVKPGASPAKKPAVAGAETKEAKFARLATKRVNAALVKIRLIGNLSGPGYVHTPEQITAINAALSSAVTAAMQAFSRTAKAAESGFKL